MYRESSLDFRPNRSGFNGGRDLFHWQPQHGEKAKLQRFRVWWQWSWNQPPTQKRSNVRSRKNYQWSSQFAHRWCHEFMNTFSKWEKWFFFLTPHQRWIGSVCPISTSHLADWMSLSVIIMSDEQEETLIHSLSLLKEVLTQGAFHGHEAEQGSLTAMTDAETNAPHSVWLYTWLLHSISFSENGHG